LSQHYIVHDVIQTEKTNVTDFMLVINGPIDTVYTGAKIIFKVVIGKKRVYPFAAPSVTCVTSIFHPNIDQHGNICLDILGSGWVAGQTLVSVAASLSSFLDEPNPDDPLYCTAANLFKKNRTMYDEKVKEFVSKYATNDEYLRIKQGGSADTKQSNIVENDDSD
jgi:ubiquitin-conjugating enzyme E2 H